MTLPTEAQYQRKPTREQAQKMLLELWEQNPSTELAKLYKWFEPTIPAKPKTAEQWVLKAVPKKDSRYYLLNRYRYSDGCTLVATDGHRIHLVRNMDYSTGYYDKSMNAVDCDARYPDFERVIPKDASEPMRLGDITLEPIITETKKGKFLKTSFKGKPVVATTKPLDLYKIGEVHVQAKYWNDAVSGLNQGALVHMHSPVEGIKIIDGDRIAVIQPIRL